jgi:AcrR family transcriptional regulator
VAAALAIVDLEGVPALSIRRLANDLRVSPMSLYWHVRDKSELLDLVGQAVLARIEIPSRRGDWRDQLRDLHRAMFRGFLAHPNTGDLLIGRARYGTAGLSLFERILSILLDSGFSAEAAFDAYQSLYVFILGSMATSSRSPEFIEIQRQGVLYLNALPPDRFPAIRAVAPIIGRRSLQEHFEVGLEVQIQGIAARLAPL